MANSVNSGNIMSRVDCFGSVVIRGLVLLIVFSFSSLLQAQNIIEAPIEPAALNLLDTEIAAGQTRMLQLRIGQSFFGQPVKIPVSVTHGQKVGPTLCLVAAIHGDELNGIEAVRRIMEEVDPQALSGTLIGVSVVNVLGFSQGTRYLPDRRDLNRYFPGRTKGSLASRIAHQLFDRVIKHCQYLVDYHTGSFKRTNLPQLRADLTNTSIRSFSQHFSNTPVLHKIPPEGTLRAAATEQGIASVTFELGEPTTIQLVHVKSTVAATISMLPAIGMLAPAITTLPESISPIQHKEQATFYASHWVRVNQGGMFTASVKLGEKISQGTMLGITVNPLTNKRYEIRSPVAGTMLGMARNQFMLPGFAAFHIGENSVNAEAAVKNSETEKSEDEPDG